MTPLTRKYFALLAALTEQDFAALKRLIAAGQRKGRQS